MEKSHIYNKNNKNMKLNLCIDGNYLMQKSVFVLYKLRNLYTDLPIILERDYNTISNLFYFSKIYFISDSRTNWRKKFYTGYKGTRKKNDSIDWNTVYEIYEEFKNGLNKKRNCEVHQIEYLEGDDIISYVMKETNKKGYSNLLIANDSDLFQLLHYDEVNKYINFMYNFKFSDETIYLPQLYNSFLESVEGTNIDDLFGDSGSDSEFVEFMRTLTTTKKVKEVDCEQELFGKILGHNKDNIKSIYMKGNRGIGKAGGVKVYDFYKETYPEIIDFNSNLFKERIIETVKYYKKLKNNDMDESMMKKLNMNLKLVKLDKKSTPSKLYEQMEDVINI